VFDQQLKHIFMIFNR